MASPLKGVDHRLFQQRLGEHSLLAEKVEMLSRRSAALPADICDRGREVAALEKTGQRSVDYDCYEDFAEAA